MPRPRGGAEEAILDFSFDVSRFFFKFFCQSVLFFISFIPEFGFAFLN